MVLLKGNVTKACNFIASNEYISSRRVLSRFLDPRNKSKESSATDLRIVNHQSYIQQFSLVY